MDFNCLDDPSKIVRGDYVIYEFSPSVYKVIRFKSTLIPAVRPEIERKPGEFLHDRKLDQSISRTRRRILELALCNDWEWFVTLTISPELDRFDLKAWSRKFRDFVKYMRKLNFHFRYLLIPERHKDGNWHLHGFLAGDLSLVSFRSLQQQGAVVPQKLVNGGFYDWPAYSSRFGFCSLAPIRSQLSAAFYVTKYITKDLLCSVTELGANAYYRSQGLSVPVNLGEVYGRHADLDACLSADFEFCATGFVYPAASDSVFGLFSHFIQEHLGYEPLFDSEPSFIVHDCLDEVDFWQLDFDDIMA